MLKKVARRMPTSLTWRLTIILTTAMTLFLLFMNLFVYMSTSNLVYQYEQKQLQKKIVTILNELQKATLDYKTTNLQVVKDVLLKYADVHQAILLETATKKTLASVIGTGWTEEELGNPKNVISSMQSVQLPGFPDVLLLTIIQDNEQIRPIFRILIQILCWSAISTFVISAIGVYQLTQIGLQPLTQLIEQIQKKEAEDLGTRLPIITNDVEIKDLVLAFNSLLDRVEDAFSKQQQFIADASHEFKTPLAIIEGYARLLQRWGKHNPEVRDEALSAMLQECSRLFELIEDLLSLAKLQDNTSREATFATQDMVPLLEEIRTTWTTVFPKHLSLHFSWDTPLTLPMNTGKIRQLFDILLDNAKKYTEEGFVEVHVFSTESWVEIHIKDTGVGIPDAERANVFERFYRVDKSRTREKGGSGLGLSIAKSIVDLHHGRIEMRRTHTGGTEVVIWLPC
ncbi:ATP-binding protein [Brevibacillus laterosporus]|uniref:sensor histidine kinase n=1 Tax=Brevibacillus laterosporus TaxID=1465 RepID=UPI0018CFCD63|nr:ATP-binding protein [Brevibacillus laterosporus]MBG9789402.1 histidine kinase [Brevibacillus laterosporus]MED1789510.1 ATP-binding protein [Brevibacillus laterosporus]